MGTIKTAISIDSGIFKKVDRLARKLRISRSQFFTQAAKHMIKKDENLELLQKINDAYKGDDDNIRRKIEKQYTRKKVVEKW
jgi:metal-responsive CopG/Arc/MetJ family transcriptional regulator